MNTSLVLLVCTLVACSVWTIHGRNLKIYIDDQEEAKMSMEDYKDSSQLPGTCWACKRSLEKLKRILGPNATAERVTSKLKIFCNEMGPLKKKCQKLVDGHFVELIKELTTADDVRTICVKIKACKPKEFLELDFENDEDPQIETAKQATKRCILQE